MTSPCGPWVLHGPWFSWSSQIISSKLPAVDDGWLDDVIQMSYAKSHVLPAECWLAIWNVAVIDRFSLSCGMVGLPPHDTLPFGVHPYPTSGKTVTPVPFVMSYAHPKPGWLFTVSVKIVDDPWPFDGIPHWLFSTVKFVSYVYSAQFVPVLAVTVPVVV